jgi:hypothetical protein
LAHLRNTITMKDLIFFHWTTPIFNDYSLTLYQPQ